MTLLMERYKTSSSWSNWRTRSYPGITPGAPERWTAQYNAIKKVAPDTQVFLTGAGNQAIFDRLNYLKCRSTG